MWDIHQFKELEWLNQLLSALLQHTISTVALLHQSGKNSCTLNDSSLLRYSTRICWTLILHFLLSFMYIANRNKNKWKPTLLLITPCTVTVAWGQFNLGSYSFNTTNIQNEIYHILLISKNYSLCKSGTWHEYNLIHVRFHNVLKCIVYSI